ncbi:amino acid-binding protein [Puteibacter caeruleilacunae]|nr:amino acid-binding protein [Puteibacter caeruleilacunae]
MAYQVSVFLENKIGHLERVTAVLKEHQINIRTMNLTHTANGWGILNLVVSDPEKAVGKLGEKGLSAALREIVVMKMSDQPGGLDQLLQQVASANVNFTNAYGRVEQEGELAFFVIDTDDVDNAKEKLTACGISILNDSDIYGGVK